MESIAQPTVRPNYYNQNRDLEDCVSMWSRISKVRNVFCDDIKKHLFSEYDGLPDRARLAFFENNATSVEYPWNDIEYFLRPELTVNPRMSELRDVLDLDADFPAIKLFIEQHSDNPHLDALCAKVESGRGRYAGPSRVGTDFDNLPPSDHDAAFIKAMAPLIASLSALVCTMGEDFHTLTDRVLDSDAEIHTRITIFHYGDPSAGL